MFVCVSRPGQAFKLSRGGLPHKYSLLQVFLSLLIHDHCVFQLRTIQVPVYDVIP